MNSPVEVDERRDWDDACDEHPGQVDVVESVVGVVPQVGHPELKASRHIHHLSHVAILVKQRHLCVKSIKSCNTVKCHILGHRVTDGVQ